MKRSTGAFKACLFGIAGAVAISSSLYFIVPSSLATDSEIPNTSSDIPARTVYGIPEIEIDHYRLTEDQYFNYLVNGVLNVGRQDPSVPNRWYQEHLDKIKAEEEQDEKEDLLKKLEELGVKVDEDKEKEKEEEEEKSNSDSDTNSDTDSDSEGESSNDTSDKGNNTGEDSTTGAEDSTTGDEDNKETDSASSGENDEASGNDNE